MSAPDRTEAKRAVARAFDRAVRACGYTNAHVGALLGLDERRVRRLRSDDPADLDVVPSLADALLADHVLGAHALRELAVERLALHGAPAVVTVEQQVAHTTQLALAFSQHAVGALADGVVAPGERPGLDADAAALVHEALALRARLRTEAR